MTKKEYIIATFFGIACAVMIGVFFCGPYHGEETELLPTPSPTNWRITNDTMPIGVASPGSKITLYGLDSTWEHRMDIARTSLYVKYSMDQVKVIFHDALAMEDKATKQIDDDMMDSIKKDGKAYLLNDHGNQKRYDLAVEKSHREAAKKYKLTNDELKVLISDEIFVRHNYN